MTTTINTTMLEVKTQYSKGKKRKILIIASLFLALIAVICISISIGAASPSLPAALRVITAKILPFLNLDPGTSLEQTIIWTIRLPRVVLALIA
jgi:ABC-type Fe3+-siderophore transport system permease subunit